MKIDQFSDHVLSRRRFCLATFGCVLLPNIFGCSVFSGKKKKSSDPVGEFEDDEEEDSDSNTEKRAFDTERKKQAELSEYVSKTGRTSKEKKKVSRGDTFLMSDKAREIYENTER